MTGPLTSKSSETGQLVRVILLVYLGHGSFHPVAVFVFYKSVFGRGLDSQVEETQKQSGASLS